MLEKFLTNLWRFMLITFIRFAVFPIPLQQTAYCTASVIYFTLEMLHLIVSDADLIVPLYFGVALIGGLRYGILIALI